MSAISSFLGETILTGESLRQNKERDSIEKEKRETESVQKGVDELLNDKNFVQNIIGCIEKASENSDHISFYLQEQSFGYISTDLTCFIIKRFHEFSNSVIAKIIDIFFTNFLIYTQGLTLQPDGCIRQRRWVISWKINYDSK